MQRGRKPSPTALKVLRGNPGKRRMNADEPQPEIAVPVAPATVTDEALAEWNRRAPQLVRIGILTEIDMPAFTVYCTSWQRYVDAQRKLVALGDVVKSPSGYPIQNPYLAIANKALHQCQQFWADFGMTPSARTRVTVRKGAAPTSRLEQFRMRRIK